MREGAMTERRAYVCLVLLGGLLSLAFFGALTA